MIRISTHLTLFAAVLLLIATGCKKEEKKPQTPAPQAPVINNPGNNDKLPVVKTVSLQSVNNFAAAIDCEMTSTGADSTAFAGICWDTVPGPTTLKQNNKAESKKGAYTSWISNPKIGATYYVRSFAQNTHGTSYGNEITVKIPEGWKTVYGSNFSGFGFATMFVSGNRLLGGVATQFQGGIHYSDNDGASWTMAQVPNSNSQISCFTSCNGILFAGTVNDGVFKSSDNGATWVTTDPDLDGNEVTDLEVIGNSVFACAGYYVYRSRDNGADWVRLQTGLNNVLLSQLAVRGNLIVASEYYFSGGAGIYVSGDEGDTWFQTAGTGLPSGGSVNDLTTGDSKIYVNIQGIMYVCADDGDNWSQMQTPVSYSSKLFFTSKSAVLWEDQYIRIRKNGSTIWEYTTLGLPENQQGQLLPISSMCAGSSYYFVNSGGRISRLKIE